MFFSSAAMAQAHSGCPERPRTVAAMRTCYRPVLVFSPTSGDPRFKQQESTLDDAADDMMDRNMLLIPILARATGYQAPLDAPSLQLPPRELALLRRHFHVSARDFRVVLLNEDGHDSLSSDSPIGISRLDSVIDAMPRRKIEMQQPNSN